MSKHDKLGIYAFLLPTLIIFFCFFLLPIVTVFATSFTAWNGFANMRFIGFDNFVKLFTYDDMFWIALKNLLLWSLITVAFHVPFGGIIAFALFKRPLGWRFVRAVYMIPNIIAVSAWAIMYRFIFNDNFGLINNIIRFMGFRNFSLNWFFDPDSAFIAVTFTWVFFSIVNTLMILAALQSIPKEIHEASKIDGVGPWKETFLINIPMIKPALSTCFVLSLAGIITQFEVIYLTTGGGPGNLTYNLALMLYDGIMNHAFGYANTVAVMMIILGILTLVVTQRVFGMHKKNAQ